MGREIRQLSNQHGNIQWLFTDREELNILDTDALEATFQTFQPEACINCAAYTAVDKAESEPELAHALNAEAVGFLAKSCQQHGSKLIHLSSDYVYHNGLDRPLREDDPTKPSSVYAQSKLEGEKQALELCRQSLVLRTSWVYSSFGHNFLKTMLQLGAERGELRVVYDQVGAPTYAAELAQVILRLVLDERNLNGIFNFSNEGVCSWYDFALAIMEMTGTECRVHPILSREYPTPAQRPSYSLLDKTKIKEVLSIEIPHWRTSLSKCLKRL